MLGGGEGLPQLVRLLERARGVPGESGRQLRNVSAGFLLNLLAGSEETQQKACQSIEILLLFQLVINFIIILGCESWCSCTAQLFPGD